MQPPFWDTSGPELVFGVKTPLPRLSLLCISSLALLSFTDMLALNVCIGSGMVRQEAEEAAAGKNAHLFLSSSNSVSLFVELLVVLSVSCSQWLLQLPALLLQLCKPISLRCQTFLHCTVHRQSWSSCLSFACAALRPPVDACPAAAPDANVSAAGNVCTVNHL